MKNEKGTSITEATANVVTTSYESPPKIPGRQSYVVIVAMMDCALPSLGLQPEIAVGHVEAGSSREAKDLADEFALDLAWERCPDVEEGEVSSFDKAQEVLRDNGFHFSDPLVMPIAAIPSIDG